MAQTEINIMFLTPNGLDGHMKLIPGDGESALTLLEQADKKLAALGCKPKPVKSYGVSAGKGNQPIPLNCPQCNQPIAVTKNWQSKDGKCFDKFICPEDYNHYHRFVPVK